MTDVAGNPEEERKADFYFQPWSQEAVCRYFYGKVSHCFQFYFKVNGPHVQTFCIEKNSHMEQFNVEIPFNDAILFQNKEKEILLDPPPKKKAQGYERSQYGYRHKCLLIAAARDLDFY